MPFESPPGADATLQVDHARLGASTHSQRYRPAFWRLGGLRPSDPGSWGGVAGRRRAVQGPLQQPWRPMLLLGSI